MSVNILYCEGAPGGIDIRLILNIVPKSCKIEPIGSKQGFAQRILGTIDARAGLTIAGLKDRDFDDNDSPPKHEPRNWTFKINNQGKNLGWIWERKEIENYLIDPEVVRRALRQEAHQANEYRKALEDSANKIHAYTAARIALSLYFKKLPTLPQNYWGEPRNETNTYFFPKDKSLKQADCSSKLKKIITEYARKIDPPEISDPKKSQSNILNIFNTVLPTCQPSGNRFKDQNYLTFFAGKDLLYGMRDQLKSFKFSSPDNFCEKILKGIEETEEDVWLWLPEWQRLRELIASYEREK